LGDDEQTGAGESDRRGKGANSFEQRVQENEAQ